MIDDIIDAADGDPTEICTKLSVANHMMNAAQQLATERDVKAIQAYVNEHTQPLVEAVVKAAPSLAPLALCLAADPISMQSTRTAQVAKEVAGRTADALLQVAIGTDDPLQSKGNVAKAADKHWDGMHELLSCEECDQEDDEVVERRLCFEAGVCICSFRGRQLHTLRNNYHAGLKLVCYRTSPYRNALKEREIFTKITLIPLVRDDAEGNDPAALALFWGVDLKAHWWQIADMVFSPYEAYLQSMADVTGTDEAYLAATALDEVPLKALICFLV